MSANISDKFNKASNMGGNYPPVATVSSARAASGSTLSCDDLSGWATDTPVHFSTFKVNADGTIDTSTQTDWKGIVIGNTITEMTRLAGAADSGNASGDKVELNPTIGWLDDLITGILVSHKQDGTLKDSIVGTSAIADSAVTTAKINGSAVTSAKLASNAVTTAKIDDAAVTSAKIDFSTLAGNYSTEEVNTGYTWIDGSPIYKKTFSLTTSTTATITKINHNITNFGILIKVEGAFNVSNGIWESLTRCGSNSGWINSISDIRGSGVDEANTIKFEVGGEVFKGRPVHFTVYYTKTS